MSDWLEYLGSTDKFVEFYGASIRTPLFTGFLTLTGFLFTVKAFLILRLQQDVYNDREYQKWILGVARRYNKKIKVYDSLRRLGRWLFFAIVFTFTTSILQLTVGLVATRWGAFIPLGVAAFTSAYFFVTLIIIRKAIRAWIDYLEEKAEQTHAAATDDDEPPPAA